MARSPIVYTLPPGTTPKVPLETIPSALWNAAMNDIANTFNTPQPIQYGGTAGTSVITGHDGLVVNGADIPTAATLVLSTATGPLVDLTGTTNVTAVTLAQGQLRITRATGNFQIIVGASLIGNAGGANVNVKAGDLIIWEGYAAGVVRFWAVPASGQSLVPSAPPIGQLYGLTLSNNVTDAVNDIDIAVGSATDNSGSELMSLVSPITKRLDASWAVGTGNGWLDTGAIANGTYHVFLIKRPDTGVVDSLASISPTAPTLPTNYTQFRRIGSILRVSAAIKAFIQYGDDFTWKDPVGDVSVTNLGTTATSYNLSVPADIKPIVKGVGYAGNTTSAGTVVYVSSLDTPDLAASAINFTVQGITTIANGSYSIQVRADAARAIRARAGAASTTFGFTTLGWIDTRGRT